jgi:hypothetical protein
VSDSSGKGYPGQLGLSNDTSEYNKVVFAIHQMLGLVRTATLVKVKAVTNAGTVSPVGFVDVLPLVNLVDGLLQSVPHATVFNIPYFRLQGGLNAIVCDPQVGDIGLCTFADRDISVVKSTKAQGNPGSRRRFDYADGIYSGGLLGATPNQYLIFTPTGLSLVDKNGNQILMTPSGVEIDDANGNKIIMGSSGITINGVLFDRSQNVTNAKNVTTQSSIDLNGHVHGGVTTGSGNTGTPTG